MCIFDKHYHSSRWGLSATDGNQNPTCKDTVGDSILNNHVVSQAALPLV
jgi:hypothetical protein